MIVGFICKLVCSVDLVQFTTIGVLDIYLAETH